MDWQFNDKCMYRYTLMKSFCHVPLLHLNEAQIKDNAVYRVASCNPFALLTPHIAKKYQTI